MDGRGANLNRKSEAPAVPGQVPLNRWKAVIRGGKPQRRVSITKTDFDSFIRHGKTDHFRMRHVSKTANSGSMNRLPAAYLALIPKKSDHKSNSLWPI